MWGVGDWKPGSICVAPRLSKAPVAKTITAEGVSAADMLSKAPVAKTITAEGVLAADMLSKAPVAADGACSTTASGATAPSALSRNTVWSFRKSSVMTLVVLMASVGTVHCGCGCQFLEMRQYEGSKYKKVKGDCGAAEGQYCEDVNGVDPYCRCCCNEGYGCKMGANKCIDPPTATPTVTPAPSISARPTPAPSAPDLTSYIVGVVSGFLVGLCMFAWLWKKCIRDPARKERELEFRELAMPITVTPHDGTRLDFVFAPEDTVLDVKKKIARRLEIELDNIALRLPTSDPGQVPAFLDDETTLRAAGTKPNDEIHLVVTL